MNYTITEEPRDENCNSFLIRCDRSGELKVVDRVEFEQWKERRRIRREN